MSIFQELADREHVFEFLTQVQSPVDVRHGPILYLEDVNVSFDGFKAINNLNLTIDVVTKPLTLLCCFHLKVLL